MENIGKRVIVLMKKMGIKQEDLASYLEISQPYLSLILSGERKMSLTIFNELCALFGCSESYLLGKNNEFSPKIFSFRSKCIDNEDLKCIASVNKLYKNLEYMNNKRND